ncbi:hypothetical protein RND71_035069 [Anisodus tanguticus]|uniref:Uncharacterized protein n=1 Tax=Anisodus tanguticus TaxID=243964 RepID=A0AAE1R4F2_9SOLA|nr:hypothetical protein RND71_035069 [Anisodus tanguticus]
MAKCPKIHSNTEVGARRLKLLDRVDDPLKSSAQIRAEAIDKVPEGIQRDQWISYVDYRLKE